MLCALCWAAANAAVNSGFRAAAAVSNQYSPNGSGSGGSSGGGGGGTDGSGGVGPNGISSGSRVSQLSVKIICVLLLIGCALITITGRGILAIVQGILGIMFAVEGFWGAVQQDLPIVRKV